MTLIAGVLCPDGFVISGDTEVTYGDLVVQGKKLSGSSAAPYQLVVGGAGDGDYLDQIKGDLLKHVASLHSPTVDDVARALREEIRAIHEDTIFSQWSNSDPARPRVELIVGFLDENKDRGLWKTHDFAVSEIAHYAFVGGGSFVANHVAEKLLSQGQRTAIVHHLLTQILLEAKTRGANVGGDTETWCVKNDVESCPFFNAGTDGKGYLWDLEGLLMSAIRDALEGNSQRLETKKTKIVAALDGLVAASRNPFASQGKQWRVTHVGRKDTHPFRDFSEFS